MIELFGTQVIPEFDKDPVHSTTRMREAARPKYERWNQPFSDVVLDAEPVIPTSALIQY